LNAYDSQAYVLARHDRHGWWVVSGELERLERVLGSRALAERYLAAVREAFRVPDETLRSLARRALMEMRASECFAVDVKEGQRAFQAVLATVPHAPELRVTKTGNYKVRVLCPALADRGAPSPWLTVYTDDREVANTLVSSPDRTFLLVGRLREREYGGGTMYVMNLVKAFSLEELEGVI